MAAIPESPKIYHITHWRNLPPIIEAGALWSDAERIGRRLDCEVVGMAEIKRRRLEKLPVPCHPGTKVGEYVPFYFCPRSIMLFLLYMRNHPELTYREGQGPIVHLVSEPARHGIMGGEQPSALGLLRSKRGRLLHQVLRQTRRPR